jgi:Na+/H+ antiporter NhaD/arsenite permease-like protein
MYLLIALIFLVGYVCIALEHPLRLNKAASALLTGTLIWTCIALAGETLPQPASGAAEEALMHHLSEISSILFFLLGAMVVVELMDAHGGFQVVTDRISGTNKRTLLCLVGLLTFFLSAVLDNLTTAIVICAVLRKMIADREDQWTFAGLVIIAANAGGAGSPIGDVTTIMLWVGGQFTAWTLISKLFVPSLICLALPLLWIALREHGHITKPAPTEEGRQSPVTSRQQYTVFFLGLATLLGVPLFKHITHLPPFMGVLLGLGVLWVYTEFVHAGAMEERGQLLVTAMLRRIDHSSILFFLGILVAVAGLATAGHLSALANVLDSTLGDPLAINTAIGLLSAVLDNVPLVAAAQGMYPLTTYGTDHPFWTTLAFCAGTGGSILIIGSAAGVAAMGVLRIPFGWYLRRIAGPAALGYFGGVLWLWAFA